MNNPRIRHLVQPPVSVVDRNFGNTNEVRIMMTSTALPIPPAHAGTGPGAIESLVSRLAVSMLRWSVKSAERRLAALERSVLVRAAEQDSSATDYARMMRHVRLG